LHAPHFHDPSEPNVATNYSGRKKLVQTLWGNVRMTVHKVILRYASERGACGMLEHNVRKIRSRLAVRSFRNWWGTNNKSRQVMY
jgi:hypothetical protein